MGLFYFLLFISSYENHPEARLEEHFVWLQLRCGRHVQAVQAIAHLEEHAPPPPINTMGTDQDFIPKITKKSAVFFSSIKGHYIKEGNAVTMQMLCHFCPLMAHRKVTALRHAERQVCELNSRSKIWCHRNLLQCLWTVMNIDWVF